MFSAKMPRLLFCLLHFRCFCRKISARFDFPKGFFHQKHWPKLVVGHS